jgi:hypothetical protein
MTGMPYGMNFLREIPIPFSRHTGHDGIGRHTGARAVCAGEALKTMIMP